MSSFKVTASGFKESELKMRLASKLYAPVVRWQLQRLGDAAVDWLKLMVRSDAFGLARKVRPNGKPPLIDTENYINSYVADVEDANLFIWSDGMNKNMPNEDLAELLEYGWHTATSYVPARPHIRPMIRWMMGDPAADFAERLVKGLGL